VLPTPLLPLLCRPRTTPEGGNGMCAFQVSHDCFAYTSILIYPLSIINGVFSAKRDVVVGVVSFYFFYFFLFFLFFLFFTYAWRLRKYSVRSCLHPLQRTGCGNGGDCVAKNA